MILKKKKNNPNINIKQDDEIIKQLKVYYNTGNASGFFKLYHQYINKPSNDNIIDLDIYKKITFLLMFICLYIHILI